MIYNLLVLIEKKKETMNDEINLSIEESIERGLNTLKEGRFNQSLRIFQSILRKQPQNIIANHNMAVILFKLGRFDKALAFFSFCLRDDTKNFIYLKDYVNTLIYLGKINQARDEFQSLKNNYEINDQLISLENQLNPDNKLDFFYKYLENLGVFDSKKDEMIEIESEARPLLTNTFLNWFETQSWSNCNLLELGSGGSTLYFSKFFKSITSYENDPKWYEEMLKKVPSRVNLIKTDSIYNSLKCAKVEDFDVVLIDVAENRANLSRILANKNYKGIVFHDNAEWYRNSINILRSIGYIEIPFFGIKPVDDHVASTSVLIQEGDVSKVFKSDWEKIPKFSSYNPTNRWDIEHR